MMFGKTKIKLERTVESIEKILKTANPNSKFTKDEIDTALLAYRLQGGVDLKRRGFAYFGETIVFDKKGKVLKVIEE